MDQKRRDAELRRELSHTNRKTKNAAKINSPRQLPGSRLPLLLLPTAPAPVLFPLPCLLQFLDLSLDELALKRAHLVEEHDAVAVIGLVKHAARG